MRDDAQGHAGGREEAGMAAKGSSGRAPRIAAGICLGLLAVLLLAFFAVNAFVRMSYDGFYAHATREFRIPGTDEGFIVQDLDRLEDGTWLFSGYDAKGGPSSVYGLRADGETERFSVTRPDGSVYDGHGSGITSDGQHVLLTDDEGYLVFDLTSFQDATDGETVQATARKSLEFAPAFMNIEQGTLFLGTFYHPGAYESPDEHKMDTPGGDWNPAIMYAYPADGEGPFGYAEQAACAYSLPARIQGVCITDDGRMALSQSYGLATSHILLYDMTAMPVGVVEEAVATGSQRTFVADGREVPLFFLDALCLDEDIEAPPMSEGVEWEDGRIFISCESASDKYLFGKLYGADAVYALDIHE